MTLLLSSLTLIGQDLDPRAYALVPINGKVLVTGYAFSNGKCGNGPFSSLEKVKANVHVPSLAVVRSFSFFGKTAQVLAALPYGFVDARGELNGIPVSTAISGFSDMRARLSVLVKVAPAAKLRDLMQAKPKQIIGTRLTITAPVGYYDPRKLVNIGTHRWSFKPELAISHPSPASGCWVSTPEYGRLQAIMNFFPETLKESRTLWELSRDTLVII